MGMFLEILLVIAAAFAIYKLGRFVLAVRKEQRKISDLEETGAKLTARGEYLKRRKEILEQAAELDRTYKEEGEK